MKQTHLPRCFVLALLLCTSGVQAQQVSSPPVDYPLGGVHPRDAKISATQQSPACPNNLCPGLGNGFYLPNVNARSINTNGRIFFEKRKVGDCVLLSDVSQNFRQFVAADSMQNFVSQSMVEANLNGSYKTSVLSVKGSVEAMTGHSSDVTTKFNTTHMEVDVITHVVDFQQNSGCWSEKNIDPEFLDRFTSLALIDSANVGSASSWTPYVQFLETQGSHVMMQQQIGSAFQQWESSSSEESGIASTLEIKGCAQVEGTQSTPGWSVQACAAYNNEERQKALHTQTNSRRLILGGTQTTRTKLTQGLTKETLNDFIEAAPQGDQAIRFVFKPIWGLLYGIYEPACAKAGPGSAACKNLQRAVTLQAAYEGWTAIGCPELKDGRGNVYQTMQVADTNKDLNINTYRCRLSKMGCRANADCHMKGLDAFCHGQGCVDKGDAISGTAMFRNKIRSEESGKNTEGVNRSCYWVPFEPRCEKDWTGELLDRDIYLQSTPSVTTLKAEGTSR
jgi:hypothetical protein